MAEVHDGGWYTGSPMSVVGGQEGSPQVSTLLHSMNDLGNSEIRPVVMSDYE